ncbi:MAG TPA: helix-turn-helix domain-containing protein [Candidatus Thermoplasmatota archaeon]|nr:helix-turn-helix domain-containing protein [Candidatus Thermoplasmatota archaeon]
MILNQVSHDVSNQTVRLLATVLGPEAAAQETTKVLMGSFDTADIVRQTKDQVTFRASVSLDTIRKTGNPAAFALEHFGPEVLVQPALIHNGYLHVRLVVTGKVDLAAMLAAYEQGVKAGRWSDFKLVRIDDFDPEQQIHGAFSENLTQKQLEVIKTALALGFYNTPRNVTLDDLSSIFGISKAAVHNRLQAAERKVIAKYFS